MFQRVRHGLYPKGVGLQHAKFWDLLHTPTPYDTTIKCCMVINLDVRKIFTGSTTPPAQTRDLFAVGNLVTSASVFGWCLFSLNALASVRRYF